LILQVHKILEKGRIVLRNLFTTPRRTRKPMNGFFEAELVLFRNKTDVMGLAKDQPSFFLVTPQRATLFEEPTIFLEEKFVQNGGTPSPNTWAAAADALKSWFQFLQASKKEWHQASRQDRKDYRDAYLMAISPRTGQPFKPSTVAARMRVIRTFYLYATRRSWYLGDIGSSSDDAEVEVRVPIDRDPMAHIHSGRRTRRIDEDLPKSRPDIVIRPFQLRDLQKLLSYIGPQAARRNGDMRESRDRLFIDLGWAVGLRVSEIRSLSTLQFLSIHPDESAPLVSYVHLGNEGIMAPASQEAADWIAAAMAGEEVKPGVKVRGLWIVKDLQQRWLHGDHFGVEPLKSHVEEVRNARNELLHVAVGRFAAAVMNPL
jgi:site-specific recombinase XerD